MPLNTDVSAALLLLEQVQERVEKSDDPKLQMHTSQDLKALISLLEDPVFRSIVTIQDSLTDLNSQLGQHPSILPGDFDINLGGQLELSLPNTPAQPLGPNMYQDIYQDSSELDDQRVPVARLVHSSSEDTSAQVTSPSLASEDLSMPPITTPTYAKEFQKVIEAASKGRQIYTVQLYKPEGTSLGFSVVGLRSKDKGELGIFLQEIQPNGIAGCDGRLVEGDQILAIDGQPLDSNISHEQAISILQKARGLVELVVARSAQEVGSSLTPDELSGASNSTATGGGNSGTIGGTGTIAIGTGSQTHSEKDTQSVGSVSASTAISSIATTTPVPTSSISSITAATAAAAAALPLPPPPPPISTTHNSTSNTAPGGLIVERSPSAVSDASRTGSDMVLNTEWAQVEVINLINDGSGLGFGIIGGRSTGVVVKTILPGGVADRDNRLQSGDHILQIGDVNLRGMGSEQVAAVLRQSGTHVRLVVARPVEPTSPDYQALGSHAPIVPTRILGDPDELERHLVHSVPDSCNRNAQSGETNYDNGYMYSQEPEIEMHARSGLIMDAVRNPVPITTVPVIATTPGSQISNLPVISMDPLDVGNLPEMERFTVELKKDIYGLGITIAGYVCEKEELSGIFVKSISEGSAADLSNKIQINDRIVEVDGHSLQGYSNHEAVEVLRSTGQSVTLCLERYLRGPKYETLQQAIAASEQGPQQPGSPSIASLPSFPISADGETTTEIEPEGESHTTVDSGVMHERDRDDSVELDEASNVEALLSDPSTELTPQIRASIKAKWQKIVGPDTEIVVAQLKKFAEGSGLGISLEGTVDVEDGQEVRPHHYIRSILPEGPVGQNGCLRSGDELLEVNGYRLLGINHMEVVSVLKELPLHVRMVCGRNIASQDPLCPIDTAQHQAAFQTRSILGGSLQNLLPAMDRLVKAKSDGSLASTTTTATVTDASLSKMKSRSLEPLTGLAMWSSEPQIIELVKGERGLGFSILDYQDPMNPNETVIVIRSLVPGGVAQVDGQLIPGDRLLFVNDIALENATLDQAVQALKGAPKGTVRIGVAKPLPIPDSIAQLVTPICIVRRSRSLPDDSESTNKAPDLVDLADLNDLTSSKSGASGNSNDKQDSDPNEETDQFEDASPVTPVHSPKKKVQTFEKKLEKCSGEKITPSSSSSDKSSPACLLPEENKTRDLLLFTDGVVPVVNVTILREAGNNSENESVRCLPAKKIIVKKLPVGKELERNLEIGKDVSVCETAEPSTSTSYFYRQERRKSIKRQGSLVKEKSIDEEIILEKSEDRSVVERKVYAVNLDDTLPHETPLTSKEITPTEEFNGERKKSIKNEEAVEENEARRLAKDRRKSLKEQKSIERVNEYLAKHSAPESSGLHDTSANFESVNLQDKRRKSLKEVRTVKTEKTVERRQSLAVDVRSMMKSSSERRKSLTKQDHVEIVGENQEISKLLNKEKNSTEEKLSGVNYSYEEEKKIIKTSDEPIISSDFHIAESLMLKQISHDKEDRKSISRQSSMKKKESVSSFEKDETVREIFEETNGEEIHKKEVKIRENVDEIFYEDTRRTDEFESTKIPDAKLVRAKIITAEEAAANIAVKYECGKTKIELNLPPEIIAMPGDNQEKINVKTKFRKAALSAEEKEEGEEEEDEGLLNLPGLTKSTSENVLVELEEGENTISGKNLKPDILLDLSKVPDDSSHSKSQEKTRDSINTSTKDKRVLSRVGSEGSKLSQEAKISSRISAAAAAAAAAAATASAANASNLIVSSAMPSSVVKDKREMTSTTETRASFNIEDNKNSIESVIQREKEIISVIEKSSVVKDVIPVNRTVICNIENIPSSKTVAEDFEKQTTRAESEGKLNLNSSLKTSSSSSDPLNKEERKEIVIEDREVNGKLEYELKTKDHRSDTQGDTNKLEIVTKTLYKSDFPLKRSDSGSGYKSVNQRLREREFTSSFTPKTESFISKLKEQTEVQQDVDLGQQRIQQRILTTDKEAEEQRQKALEKQREHEKFLQDRRTLVEKENNAGVKVNVSRSEDNLIGKEHSLEYQSQTLEARFEELDCKKASISSFDLSYEYSGENENYQVANVISCDFKAIEKQEEEEDKEEKENVDCNNEELLSIEKREAETQTQQETKSTQCGTDEVFDHSCLKTVDLGLSSLVESPELPFGSPRKEVETQTQGETKGTQCGPDDLAETFFQLKTFFRQKSNNTDSLGSLASPRREVEVQTEQESKSVQCTPDDIPDCCHLSKESRREVEVQTYQESKSTQFSNDDIPQNQIPIKSDTNNRQLTLANPEPVPGSSIYTSSPIIVLVDGRTDMTVTHNYKDKDGNVVWAKHWGPERMVEIYREPKSSLGLSIVGGKVDLYHGGPNSSENISGIFIKNVLPNSPAGRTGDLKTGDRIIEVDGVDLRNSTHDRAVKAIQAAGNPVCLLVQSLVHLSPDEERTSSNDTDDNSAAAAGRGVRRQGTRGHGAIVGAAPSAPTTSSFRRKPPAVSPSRTITPELIQEGIEDEAKQGTSRSDYRRQSTKNDSDRAGPSSRRSSMKQSLRKKAPSPPKGPGILREVSEEGEEQTQKTKPKYSSDESSDEEDTRDLEGNVYTKAGIEISRKSAGNVKRTKEEIEADPEEEDEFGYTTKKIKKRYDSLGHPVVMVRLEKDRKGLGISLAGHKDRNRMAVFVCGLNPKGVAHKTGGLLIGDEILEVNGTVLQGRCHLNASAMIKGMAGTCFKVIVLRRSSAVNDLAVKPIVQFPPTLDEDDPERFSQYKGVRTVSIKKGQYGLGIMIIEGKHAEVGQGIFVSDIQEGSAAEQAGLQVGDMILAVNLDSLLGSSYDEATGLLKKTEGVVTLTVCNPNQSKLAKEEEDKAKGESASGDGDASKTAKEPEKPKEPEPPKDPKDCEISVGRETTIEFAKDKDKAIGLTITGGSGTPIGGIVILEVFPEGAAGKDGRLKPGDQIIEMCHESFKTIEHTKAHEAILKANGPIQMVVFRDDKPKDEFDVEVPKKSGKGVGLCLTGFKSGKGAYVSDMLPGGSALESGKIAKGDRVVAVGGQDVREAPVEDVALHVKVSNPVQLKLARYKPVKQ